MSSSGAAAPPLLGLDGRRLQAVTTGTPRRTKKKIKKKLAVLIDSEPRRCSAAFRAALTLLQDNLEAQRRAKERQQQKEQRRQQRGQKSEQQQRSRSGRGKRNDSLGRQQRGAGVGGGHKVGGRSTPQQKSRRLTTIEKADKASFRSLGDTSTNDGSSELTEENPTIHALTRLSRLRKHNSFPASESESDTEHASPSLDNVLKGGEEAGALPGLQLRAGIGTAPAAPDNRGRSLDDDAGLISSDSSFSLGPGSPDALQNMPMAPEENASGTLQEQLTPRTTSTKTGRPLTPASWHSDPVENDSTGADNFGALLKMERDRAVSSPNPVTSTDKNSMREVLEEEEGYIERSHSSSPPSSFAPVPGVEEDEMDLVGLKRLKQKSVSSLVQSSSLSHMSSMLEIRSEFDNSDSEESKGSHDSQDSLLDTTDETDDEEPFASGNGLKIGSGTDASMEESGEGNGGDNSGSGEGTGGSNSGSGGVADMPARRAGGSSGRLGGGGVTDVPERRAGGSSGGLESRSFHEDKHPTIEHLPSPRLTRPPKKAIGTGEALALSLSNPELINANNSSEGAAPGSPSSPSMSPLAPGSPHLPVSPPHSPRTHGGSPRNGPVGRKTAQGSGSGSGSGNGSGSGSSSDARERSSSLGSAKKVESTSSSNSALSVRSSQAASDERSRSSSSLTTSNSKEGSGQEEELEEQDQDEETEEEESEEEEEHEELEILLISVVSSWDLLNEEKNAAQLTMAQLEGYAGASGVPKNVIKTTMVEATNVRQALVEELEIQGVDTVFVQPETLKFCASDTDTVFWIFSALNRVFRGDVVEYLVQNKPCQVTIVE